MEELMEKSNFEQVLYLGLKVKRRTDNGFLSVSDLMFHNNHSSLNQDRMLRIDMITSSVIFQNKMFELLKRVNLNGKKIIVSQKIFLDSIERTGVVETLKSFGVYQVTGRGENRQTWAISHLWVLIAMECHPKLYAEAVVEGYDPEEDWMFGRNKDAEPAMPYKPYQTYVMVDNNTGLYKIGISRTPYKREQTLQSEKPAIKMLFFLNMNVEKDLHEKFDSKRVRGEWFALDESDLLYIKNLTPF